MVPMTSCFHPDFNTKVGLNFSFGLVELQQILFDVRYSSRAKGKRLTLLHSVLRAVKLRAWLKASPWGAMPQLVRKIGKAKRLPEKVHTEGRSCYRIFEHVKG